MRPGIHVVTLAVAELERALTFYRDGMGFPTEGLIGTEFRGDEDTPDGTTAVFQLDGGLMLSIYPRSELAKDAGVPLAGAKPGEFSIGHVVATRTEVDEVIAQARAAGAVATDPHDRPWGIYSGYFQDPDGHLWEVIWNPALDLGSSGSS
jgi:catechol 2,3-dioxygenase-like lactoylglutathione lyase family enzyme